MQKKSHNYDKYLEEGFKMYQTGAYKSKMEVARILVSTYKESITHSPEAFRKNYLSPYISFKLTEEHPALAEYCEDQGLPIGDVSHYWSKGSKFSIFLKSSNPITYEDIRDDIIKEMQEYSVNYPEIIRPDYSSKGSRNINEPHLLVIDPADIHLGKLSTLLGSSTDYNSKIAVKRVHEGVRGIIHKASGYTIEKVLLVIGNDILHIDSPKRTTSAGTPQDTDGMWYTNFKIAKKLYVDIIEILMQVADVHVMFNPSNHDFMSGFFLSDAVATWFRNSKNVTFDVGITHRKYYLYHTSLIGTSHGDGAKGIRLSGLMAEEVKKLWAESEHRYWYLHHVHHKDSKDYGSVNVETLRSPSGTDMWHHIKGFQNQPKAIEGYIHSRAHGQVARLTHVF